MFLICSGFLIVWMCPQQTEAFADRRPKLARGRHTKRLESSETGSHTCFSACGTDNQMQGDAIDA
jgi:hypothetical protein